MKLNKQIFGLMGVTAMLLTACTANDNIGTEPQANENDVVYGKGSQIVTLNITPDSFAGTRSVSDGTKAASLYFEVYEVTDENEEIKGATTDEAGPTEPGGQASTRADEGAKVYVSLDLNKPVAVKDYKASIKLAVDNDKKYRISLWACKSELVGEGKLFTITSAPMTVAVDYGKITNNYEEMDAFTASKYFAGSAKTVDVVLHRPFAQLNVGTSGADYENYKQGNIYPNSTVTYSQVVVSDVYSKFDVANDHVAGTPDKVTLKFAKTIAEQKTNNGNEEYLRIPLNTAENRTSILANPKDEWKLATGQTGTDFLKYKEKYPTTATGSEGKTLYLTEEFKYLSMAYVLVKDDKGNNDGWTLENPNDKDESDVFKSTTLNSVEVYFAEDDDSEEGADATYKNGRKYFTVTNVPVHRNWRTNLIGGLTDPDDPKDPDDPSSLFYNIEIAVYLCPIYYGEFNGLNNNYDDDNHYDGLFGGWFPTNGDSLHKPNHPKEEAKSE